MSKNAEMKTALKDVSCGSRAVVEDAVCLTRVVFAALREKLAESHMKASGIAQYVNVLFVLLKARYDIF